MESGCPIRLQPAKNNRLPLVFSVPDYSNTEHLVLDISTKEFRTISHPDLLAAACVYTKGDWLLLCQMDNWWQYTYFLLNPFTGSRIDLPSIHKKGPGAFTFSMISGNPHRIVSVNNEYPYGISIRVMCPGDEAWEVHEFKECDKSTLITAAALVGEQVLCLDHQGRVVVFDLSDGRWMYYLQPQRSVRGFRYFIESDGEVLKVDCPYPLFSSFTFSRLDQRAIDWVELDDIELENTSWFLGPCPSFRVKEAGKKVYTLQPRESGGHPDSDTGNRKRRIRVIKGRKPGDDIDANVYVHDLSDGSSQSLLPNSFPTKSVRWFDADLPC